MSARRAAESVGSSRDSFVLAAPGIRMVPSLLSADFSRLREEVAAIEEAGASVLHLDVMDGHFVPNISFGIPVIASLRSCTKLFFDAHLMISQPMRYAEAFVKAGCDHLTFHIETTSEPGASAGAHAPGAAAPKAKVNSPHGDAQADLPDACRVIDHIRGLGASVGVCLNPGTPISIIEPILEQVDLVLVMSVWPGFGGQKFIPDALEKLTGLRQRLKLHQRLEIDGGIDETTIGPAVRAGADTIVAGSAIFGTPDAPAAMRRLHQLAIEAVGQEGTR